MKNSPQNQVAFKLFRCTAPTADVEYVGSLRLANGQVIWIEAIVVEHERPDGTKGKHFEGRIAKSSGAHILKTAKPDGPAAAAVRDDLVARMEAEVELDDSEAFAKLNLG